MSMENSVNAFNGLFSQYLEAYKARNAILSRLVNTVETNTDPAKRAKDAENVASAFVKTILKTAENRTKTLGKPAENIEDSDKKTVVIPAENFKDAELEGKTSPELNEAKNSKSADAETSAEDIQPEKPKAEKAASETGKSSTPEESKKETPSEKDLFEQMAEPTPDPRPFPIPEEKPALSDEDVEALRGTARALCNAHQLKYGRQATKEMVFGFGHGSITDMQAEQLHGFLDYVGAKLNEAEV